MGLTEYYRATGEPVYLEEARELFWKIVQWIQRPALLDRMENTALPPVISLASEMVLMCMAMDLLKISDDPRVRLVLKEAVERAIKHYDPGRCILLENVTLDGSDIGTWPEGRHFIPGHSIEVAWFILHALEFVTHPTARQVALDALEGSLEFGWDREFGGLTYFMDVAGKPSLFPEAPMKLWWPHTEALYALLLAYSTTHEQKWLAWLETVDAYAYRTFVDEEYGEWFGYCDRQGRLTHTCKGGSYKAFFHVPRFLMFSVQLLDRINKP